MDNSSGTQAVGQCATVSKPFLHLSGSDQARAWGLLPIVPWFIGLGLYLNADFGLQPSTKLPKQPDLHSLLIRQ